MKKLVEEVSSEGLESLLGETVILWCMNYNYVGELIGVDDVEVLLEDAHIVYETGAFTDGRLKDAQRLPAPSRQYVRLSAVESYGRYDGGV